MTASDHTTKTCTLCKRELPADTQYFATCKAKKGGLYSWCRECHRGKSNAYYESHRQERIDYERNRRIAYREEINRRVATRRAANTVKIREQQRNSYRRRKPFFTPEQKQKLANNGRRWRHQNPDKARVIKQRRRARYYGAEGSFTEVDIRLQYRSQCGRCWHCSESVGTKYHIDHLRPLARGGSNYPENIVISCPSCNSSKGDKLIGEWNGRLR